MRTLTRVTLATSLPFLRVRYKNTMSAKGLEERGAAAGKVAVEATDVEEEEASELASVDELVRSERAADAEKMAEAVTEEETDHRLRVTTRDGAELLATETTTRRAVAEETMTKEEEEADLVMAAEELTSTARDQEETDREVAEEEVRAALVQDPEVSEVAVPKLEPLSASEHHSPVVR